MGIKRIPQRKHAAITFGSNLGLVLNNIFRIPGRMVFWSPIQQHAYQGDESLPNRKIKQKMIIISMRYKRWFV